MYVAQMSIVCSVHIEDSGHLEVPSPSCVSSEGPNIYVFQVIETSTTFARTR